MEEVSIDDSDVCAKSICVNVVWSESLFCTRLQVASWCSAL